MARLTKKESELKSITEFEEWFNRIDKALKMLAVFILGISFLSYISILIAGFIHTIYAIRLFEIGWAGFFATLFLSIGFVGTELSAVYGVVYEVIQSDNSKPKENLAANKKFHEKLGLSSVTELGMYFMAFITGFANFLYSLSVWKTLFDSGKLNGYISIEALFGSNPLDAYFTIDPIHLLALILFSTIIPIIMIIQSKMQIQFLRFIMKTIRSIKNIKSKVEIEVKEQKEVIITTKKKAGTQIIKNKDLQQNETITYYDGEQIQPVKKRERVRETISTENKEEIDNQTGKKDFDVFDMTSNIKRS